MFRKLTGRLVGALLVVSLHGTARADNNLDVGAWGGSGGSPGLTGGYWFEAPVDFVIDSLFLLSGGSEGSTLQVLLLDSAPPLFNGGPNSFSSLGYWSGVSSASASIQVYNGDIIGVLGYDGLLGGPFGRTPYRDAAGPYATVIGDDLNVTLNSLKFSDTGAANPASDDFTISSEADEPTGSIGMTYHVGTVAAVPEPETYAMLLAGLGLLGFAARRRKQKELAAA